MADRRTNYRNALVAEGFTAEEIAEALDEVEAQDGDRRASRALRAGVPPLYIGVGFDDIELDERREAIMAARNWAVHMAGRTGRDEISARRGHAPRNPADGPLLERLARGNLSGPMPHGLYLWSAGGEDEDKSGFGTGKTRIAAAVAQHVLSQGNLSVRWLDIVRAMTDLNRPFSSRTYGQAADRLGAPTPGELIVLDDIDKQPPTDRNLQPIFALVNDCVNGEVPLLITANRSVDDLLEDWGDRFGVAVASRIIGHCLDVEVRGRDRRLDPVQ